MLYSLNTFRFVGTLLVFISHLYMLPPQRYTGAIGVELFFVLSGFTIYYVYGEKRLKFKSFVAKRAKKLLPLYYITAFLSLGYMILYGYDLLRTLLKLICHLLCLQTLYPMANLTTVLNGASWYVATLMFCYAFFVFSKNIQKSFVLMIVYTAILISIRPVIESFQGHHTFFYFSPFARIIDFYIGMLAAYCLKFNGSMRNDVTIGLELSVLFLIILFVNTNSMVADCQFVLGVLFAVLMFVSVRGKGICYRIGITPPHC